MKTQAWTESKEEMVKRVGSIIDEIYKDFTPETYPLLLTILSESKGNGAQRCAHLTFVLQEAKLLMTSPEGKEIIKSFTEIVEKMGIPTALIIACKGIIGAEEFMENCEAL